MQPLASVLKTHLINIPNFLLLNTNYAIVFFLSFVAIFLVMDLKGCQTNNSDLKCIHLLYVTHSF